MTSGRVDRATCRILEGPLAWEIARFGAPLALAMGLQVTFNLVDAYLIARLSPEVAGPALGAIGICDQIAALGTILSYGISIATAALLSQYQGRGDTQAVRKVAAQSMWLVLGLSGLFGLAGWLWAEPVIVDVVGAKGAVATMSIQYLRVIVVGSFSIFLLLQLTSMQRALGSSKTPVMILLGSNALNLVLAVLFCYGPGEAPEIFSWGPPIAKALHIPRMELVGAAWATIGARVVFLIPLIFLIERRFHLFRGHLSLPRDTRVLRSITRIAWPASTQFVVRITAMLLTHSLVARAFTTAEDQHASTALGIVFRLETLALFIAMGWGSAAQTFLGQNEGAGQHRRALDSGWYATAYNAVAMAGLAVLFYLAGDAIVRFFDSDSAVVDMAVQYLRVVSPFYLALGVGIVLGNAITGAGATRLTLTIDSLVVLLVQLPLSLWAVHHAQTPERLWAVLAGVHVAFACVYGFVYRKGHFLRRLA